MDVRPAEELELRYRDRRRRTIRYARRVRRVIVAKRVYMGSFIGYAVFDPTVAVVLLPVAVSLIPITIIQHLLTARSAHNRRSAAFYARALDRLEGSWAEQGDRGDRYEDNEHPYAQDLDLFGRGSLFQLLCTPCTAQGRDALANCLKSPSMRDTIRLRQEAVLELREQLDLREELNAAGARHPFVDTDTLQAVAGAQPLLSGLTGRLLAPVAAWFWLVMLIIGFRTGGICWTIFLCGLAIQTVGYILLRPRILSVANRGHEVGQCLTAMSDYSRVLGSTLGNSPLLRDIRESTHQRPRPMARFLAESIGLVAQVPAAYFLAVQIVPLLELRLLRRLRGLPRFWTAIGQFEVLAALSTYAYEQPADCIPEIVETGPCFEARQLGHPLLDEASVVRNDVTLNSQTQMLMVSGSNMSGKSTLLRTVGINAVLALAGAPVRARSLNISPLVIGSAMRFQDSLEEGTSYFYSVLSRLRRVLNLLDEERPLLFLFDEILQGTNSHDRLAGAEAVIRKLLGAGAIGLVTTHDLELTQVADHLAPSASNVHFVDTVADGKLHFDYRMRQGVVQSSNAIQLMRDMGLDV